MIGKKRKSCCFNFYTNLVVPASQKIVTFDYKIGSGFSLDKVIHRVMHASKNASIKVTPYVAKWLGSYVSVATVCKKK